MKKPLRIIIPVLIIIIGSLLYFLNKNNVDPDKLILSGNIEVTEIEMSFKIPGILTQRKVSEGDKVEAGQLIAQLDKTDLELTVKQAESNLLYAKTVLAELVSGSRLQEIAVAQADLERALAGENTAQSQLKLAKADIDRFSKLIKQGSISQSEYEKYQTQYETVLNAYEQAKASVKSAQEKLSLLKEGPRPEKIAQAQAQVNIAEESFKQAQQQLTYTDIVAPISGVVLSTSAEIGEFLVPGSPVLTLGDINKVWLRAYVNETAISKVKLNQEVDVTTDAYPGKVFKGRISFINSQAEFTPKTVQTFEERVKLMYRIKIECINPNGELKPGMPADALIKRKA